MFYVRYLTAVNPILSTSPPVQKYHTLTSGSEEVPLLTCAGNPSPIGKVPAPKDSPHYGMRRSATITLISYAEQGIIIITNVLQGNDTIILVDCTSE